MSLFSTQTRGERGIIFDAETHSRIKPKVIETAYMYVDPDTLKPESGIHAERFDPGVPIEYGAMAAHHILQEELSGLAPSDSFALPDDVGYIIGHKIDFDLGAIGNPDGIREIDTLPLAQRAWPEQGSHTQSALFYMIHAQRGLDMISARDFLKDAHSAPADIQICSFILDQLLLEYAEIIRNLPVIAGIDGTISMLDSMHLISRAARVPLVMNFGKHEGMAPWDVPASYKSWYMGTENPDPYYVLAMTRGGNTAEGQAILRLAKQIFGNDSDPIEEPLYVAAPAPQRRFTF